MTGHVLKLVTTTNKKEKTNVSGQPEENVINTINNTVSQTVYRDNTKSANKGSPNLLQTGIPNLESIAEKVT